ncbi:hypothetical protein OkiPb00494_15150 [Escherichia coli]
MTSKYSLYIYNKYRRYLFSKKYILPKLINGGGGEEVINAPADALMITQRGIIQEVSLRIIYHVPLSASNPHIR